MEIPSQVSYEVLELILGTVFILLPFYVLSLPSIYQLTIDGVEKLSPLFMIAGIWFFINGFSEIESNYKAAQDMKELEMAKQINEYIKYFETEGKLSENDKEGMLSDMKEYLKQDSL